MTTNQPSSLGNEEDNLPTRKDLSEVHDKALSFFLSVYQLDQKFKSNKYFARDFCVDCWNIQKVLNKYMEERWFVLEDLS